MLGGYLVAKQESLPAQTRPEKRWITAWHLPWGHLQRGNTHSASVKRCWRDSHDISNAYTDDNTHLLQMILSKIVACFMASLCLHTFTHVPCLCAKYRRRKHVMQCVVNINSVQGKPALTELSIHNSQNQPGEGVRS